MPLMGSLTDHNLHYTHRRDIAQPLVSLVIVARMVNWVQIHSGPFTKQRDH